MSTISRSFVAAVLALAMFGCEDEAAGATEQQEAAEETAAVVAEAAEEATGEGTAGIEGVANALEEAAEAAAEGEGEGTHCEQALAGMLAMREQLEASLGGDNEAPPLDEAGFLAACQGLPEGAQQCMVMSYAISHQEECAEFQQQIQNAAPRPGG